ncbi:MAG: hypothetical protein KDC57_00625 [Saprospiraceae bacterium]|nr:hypothetical protein [Saprospiraceae bacterium]
MESPVILLTFANDRDPYLPLINRERKNIMRTLRRHDDKNLIRLISESDPGLPDMMEMIRNYQDHLALFQFSSHRGGTSLGGGAVQSPGADELSTLLGSVNSLQLVFLSGNADRKLVESLFKHGVKAVLATSTDVADKQAIEFAEQFYHALASYTNIQKAFDIASSFLAAKYEDMGELHLHRDASARNLPAELAWGLYLSAGNDQILDWSLPKSSRRSAMGSRVEYETQVDVNDILIDVICEQIAEFNPDLDHELSKEELDIPSIKREIIDCFPTPIGEQLRKLFTRSNDISEPDEMEIFSLARLEQIVLTYRTSMQFVSFILLSQLWDEKYRHPELHISDDYIVEFNSFFALRDNNYESFDYVKLIRMLTDLFDEWDIKYFIDELKKVRIEEDQNTELFPSYVFMDSLHQDILDHTIQAEDIEGLCLEAEEHLGIILKSFAFLVKYKLSTIKNIEIIKRRHEDATYRHSQILLNKALTVASTGISEIGVVFTNFTDNKSVLFLKTENNEIKDYLSLSPFIIDQNALNKDYSSKLYLYAYEHGDAYYFEFLNNRLDKKLLVDSDQYDYIKEEFTKFKAILLGVDYQPKSPKTVERPASRFMKRK